MPNLEVNFQHNETDCNFFLPKQYTKKLNIEQEISTCSCHGRAHDFILKSFTKRNTDLCKSFDYIHHSTKIVFLADHVIKECVPCICLNCMKLNTFFRSEVPL